MLTGALCSTGTCHTGVVAFFTGPLTLGSPQAMTKTDRIAKGSHARAICPGVYRDKPVSGAKPFAELAYFFLNHHWEVDLHGTAGDLTLGPS